MVETDAGEGRADAAEPAKDLPVPLGRIVRSPPAQVTGGVDPVEYCPDPYVVVPGNRVTVLQDGSEAFPAMLDAIARARHAVHLETYIFADDRTGRTFAAALADAAARGVEVALIYDSLGSWRAGSALFEWLSGRGVKVLGYKPLRPWRRGWGWARRDHRKLLVVDGAVGFTGGINLGDQWADAKDGGLSWRDTMLRIRGSGAAAMDVLFREVWDAETARQRLPLPLRPPVVAADPVGPQPLPREVEHARIWVVGNREYARRRAIRKAYRYAMARARKYVFIANPYFVPDGRIVRSLRSARRRGVRVALLLPGRTDQRLVQWAGRRVYEKLLAWGIEIHLWQQPVFHAKAAVIDGAWSSVGSYNLDTQSLRYNLEATAIVASRALAEKLEQTFCTDFGSCRRLTLEEWRRRPWWWRIPERFCYALRAWL